MLGKRFKFPVLRRARFAKNIKRANADEGIHFLRQRLDAQEKIGERRKRSVRPFAQDGFFGAQGQAFDLQDRDANGVMKYEG